MVSGPLAEAHIEITADPKGADREIDRLGDELDDIERIAQQVGEAIEDAFREAFRAVSRGADETGEDVEDSFREADRAVSSILAGIGGPELFAAVSAQAEAAGESIEDSFDEAARQADGALRDIGGANAFGPVVVGAEVAGEQIENSFQEASRSSVRALSRIGLAGGSFSLLTTGALAFASALGTAAAATVGFGLKGAASLEQTRIGFESLLGSAEEADAFIREMQDFAANTPFEFQGLADNARRLLAVSEAAGIARDELLPTVETIGDLTSVLGAPPDAIDRVVGALGQMASRGKVSTQELLQLSEALPGFAPFQVMADGLGITTGELQKLVETGAIPATEGIDLLLQGMKEFPGAAGAMAKQAQTLTGVFSTFKDTIQIALTDAFQPLVPQIKDTLREATDVIGDALGTLAPALSSTASALLGGLLDIFAGLPPGLAALFSGLGEGLEIIGPTLAAVAGDISVAFAPLVDLLPVIAEAAGVVLQVFGTLGATVIPPLLTAIGAIVTALTPLLHVIGALVQELAVAFGPVLADIADVLAEFGGQVADVFRSLFDTGVITTLAEAFGQVAEAIGPVVEAIGGALGSAIIAVLPAFSQLVELMAGTFAQVLTAVIIPVLPALEEAFLAISQALATLLPPLLELAITLAEALAPIMVQLAGIVGDVLADGFSLFADLVGKLSKAFAPLIPVIGDVVEALGDALLQVLDELAPVMPELAEAFAEIALALAEILVALVPLIVPLTKLVTLFITELGAPVLVLIAKAFALVAIALADVVTALAQVVGFVADNAGPALSFLWNDIFVPFGEFLAGTFMDAVGVVGDIFTNVLVPAFQGVTDAATWLWQNVLAPFINFMQTVLTPVLVFVGALLFGPFLVSLTAVSIAANALWNFILVPLGGFLANVFGPVLSFIADVALAGLSAAFDGASAVAGFLWHDVLAPIGRFLTDVFAAAVDVGTAAWDAFKLAVDVVSDALDVVWNSWLKPVANWLKSAMDAALDVAGSAWSGFAKAIKKVVDALKSVVDFAKKAVDAVGGVIDKVKGLPGGGIAEDVFKGTVGRFLAAGGLVDEPTVAVLGELSRRELVLPLTDPARTLALAHQHGLFDVLARAGAFGGSPLPLTSNGDGTTEGATVINIEAHINGPITQQEARAVGREIGKGAGEVLDKRRARVEARIAS